MQNERGVALIVALFLMMAMSVVGASLMFLSQTETYASMNYRMMSQARYAGEAAVQKAANFLMDDAQYTIPSDGGTDDINTYNRSVSPVLFGTQPVVLSASADETSNYPLTDVQTAFNTAAQGTLQAGTTTIEYSAYAKLLSMQMFESYGGTPNVVQTWEITGVGKLSGSRNASVEVVAIVEAPKVPASSYGAFGTDNTCGALTFGGDTIINSYDSTTLSGSTTPALDSTGGDVGTNGNMTIGGHVDVQGDLYTPRTGVGSCTSGNVVALTTTGRADVEGDTIPLPSTVEYPTPELPGPSLLPAASISTVTGACALLGLGALTPPASCTTSGSTITINGGGMDLTMPSITLSSSISLVLVADNPAAQYNFNSITLAGGSSIKVSATTQTEGVLVGIIGKNPDGSDIATPMDFTGGTYAAVTGCATCSAYDASMLQFLYGGTGQISITGNNNAAATIYAPNASVTIYGNADVYGSILGNRINNTGNGDIHYDRRLQRDFYVAGHPMASSFTWKKE